MGTVLGLVPVALDLSNQIIPGLFDLCTNSLALALEESGELGGVPVAVGLNHEVTPVLFNQALKVFAVSWCRIGNIVVRQPPLELGLVPLVVDCRGMLAASDTR